LILENKDCIEYYIEYYIEYMSVIALALALRDSAKALVLCGRIPTTNLNAFSSAMNTNA